jgi:hypothetical protein
VDGQTPDREAGILVEARHPAARRVPTDIITSVTVGAHLARDGDAWSNSLPFIGLTLLLLASPAILVLLLGRHAQVLLPKVRDWMNTNSWIVSELVILLFVGITINSLAS